MRSNHPPEQSAAPALASLPFHILLALGDGPAHGYAIGQEVERRSGGRLDPTTGALYQALKRLTGEGLVAPLAEPPEPTTDARRKYFELRDLTPLCVWSSGNLYGGVCSAL